MDDRDARFTGPVGEQAEDVVQLFAPLGEVGWQKMFGGAGIFLEGRMFALIDAGGQLHLKVGDANRERYEQAGATKHSRMPYYSVPEEVRGDSELLRAWARESAELAR